MLPSGGSLFRLFLVLRDFVLNRASIYLRQPIKLIQVVSNFFVNFPLVCYYFSDHKKINRNFGKKLLFHQPTNPTRWIFFGEKAILEPSLIKVR